MKNSDLEILSENKSISDENEALTELAFAHYPVRLGFGGEEVCFEDFTSARLYVEKFFAKETRIDKTL